MFMSSNCWWDGYNFISGTMLETTKPMEPIPIRTLRSLFLKFWLLSSDVGLIAISWLKESLVISSDGLCIDTKRKFRKLLDVRYLPRVLKKNKKKEHTPRWYWLFGFVEVQF